MKVYRISTGYVTDDKYEKYTELSKNRVTLLDFIEKHCEAAGEQLEFDIEILELKD